MTYSAALAYLTGRFGGVHSVTYDLITMPDGRCTGIIIRVGRSKHVAGVEVEKDMLQLFADGIAYSDDRRVKRAAEMKRIALVRAEHNADEPQHHGADYSVTAYISEGLGEV